MIFNTTFWRACAGEHILIFQSDAAMCANSTLSINHYLKYDYVGGACGHLSLPTLRSSYNPYITDQLRGSGGRMRRFEEEMADSLCARDV